MHDDKSRQQPPSKQAACTFDVWGLLIVVVGSWCNACSRLDSAAGWIQGRIPIDLLEDMPREFPTGNSAAGRFQGRVPADFLRNSLTFPDENSGAGR